jgi:serine/threonine protein kinase
LQGDEALKTQTLDSGIENVAYTAPEVYMEGSYSTKSDIYSVGFVIWELAMRIVKGTPHVAAVFACLWISLTSYHDATR